jgi:hypothetical protein
MAKKSKKSRVITKKQFDSWSPQRREAALNNDRIRVRIEDRALPPEWLERRKKARWNRTPISPGSGTTYGDLDKQRAYLEPLTFGEGDRQLADRTANLAAARERDANWFTQYRADVAAAQQRAIGAQTAAAEGNRAFIESANQASNASRDQIVAQLQARAGQLGQTSQAPEYQQLADQAAAARAAAMTNTAQRQLADARTGVDVATAGVTTAGLKDLEARGFRDRQASALDTDKRDYGSKKEAWRAKFIDDAIAEARKQVLEDRAFQVSAADKAADNARADAALRNQRRNARNQQRNADRNYNLAVQREQRQAANQRRSNTGDGSGPKPATPKETRTQAAAIRRAVTLIRYMKRAGKDENGVKYTTGGIRAALADKGIDTDVVNTAMDVVYLGGIGRLNRSRWRKAGYNPRDFGQRFK